MPLQLFSFSPARLLVKIYQGKLFWTIPLITLFAWNKRLYGQLRCRIDKTYWHSRGFLKGFRKVFLLSRNTLRGLVQTISGILTQLVLLRVLTVLLILLLTTLVRFANLLRLDQVDLIPHHVPGSAMFKALLQVLCSGRHLMKVLSPRYHQSSCKLLVVNYTR